MKPQEHIYLMRRFVTPALTAILIASLSACGEVRSAWDRVSGNNAPPDSLPRLLNDSLPFKYPVALYMQLIDDSVTLRLHIDEFGRPLAESTQVAVPARYAEFDSAAVAGSRELVFRPAIRRGRSIPYTVLFPIHFKIPTQPISSDSSGPQ